MTLDELEKEIAADQPRLDDLKRKLEEARLKHQLAANEVDNHNARMHPLRCLWRDLKQAGVTK